MDDYKPLAVFAETVDAGSMSAAARRLGMSPSAVSQTIRVLEAQNGVVLLHRSTRKLTLTAAGERYYPHCRRLLDAARAASESLERTRAEPVGELRVAAPVGFANHIPPALAPLLADAPQLRLRLLLDDAMIDLIEARIDLAVRVGRLDDSQWIARRLGELRTVLCASPEYLARHGAPQTPLALQTHQWIASERGQRAPKSASRRRAGGAAPAVASRPVVMPVELRDARNRRQTLDVEARIASNNQIALQAMCENGLGIARLAHADVLASLQRGALVQVLPDWELPSMPVWAVTPRRDGDDAKVRGAWGVGASEAVLRCVVRRGAELGSGGADGCRLWHTAEKARDGAGARRGCGTAVRYCCAVLCCGAVRCGVGSVAAMLRRDASTKPTNNTYASPPLPSFPRTRESSDLS